MEEVNQTVVSITDLDRFPPTVVDHEYYEGEGYDLYLLDSGKAEQPRFIRTFDDGRPMERYL